MKTAILDDQRSRQGRRGFTLPEIMITAALAVLLMGGMLAAQFFGMRMYEISKIKLGASDESRKAVSLLIAEIRSAKIVRVGNGALSTFSEVAVNLPQKGNAIQVYSSINTNTFIRYYLDATDKKLKRTTNGAAAASVVANAISNNVVFTAEDFSGLVLTNNENNRVIGLALEFYQLEYPAVNIGPGNLYDFYQLRTKITRRALE